MQILTLKDETFYLNDLPEEVDDDCRFAVLDNSDPQNPDYFFQPLIFLESSIKPSNIFLTLILSILSKIPQLKNLIYNS